MARKRVKKVPAKRNSFFNFTESYTSLILGAIVVLIIGILFVFFAKGNNNMQTISTKDESSITSIDSKTSPTYTIKPGDDLWSISENVYKDGYRWVEIAKVNKLENPGLIHAGNKLIIPTIAKQESVAQKTEQVPQTQSPIIQNNSITGSSYKIKEGDNLWDISVRAYGDGFKWPEIAKANNLENPDLIFADNILKIPR